MELRLEGQGRVIKNLSFNPFVTKSVDTVKRSSFDVCRDCSFKIMRNWHFIWRGDPRHWFQMCFMFNLGRLLLLVIHLSYKVEASGGINIQNVF